MKTYREITLCAKLSLIILGFVRPGLQAQGHDWWANNVGWDGDSHWSTYIISSAAFMGPNALPIPRFEDGVIADQHFIDITSNAHFTPGDYTYNLKFTGGYTLVQNLIAFEVSWVPVEYFNMSHEKKTERQTFHVFYNNKFAVGDLYLHTNIQLTRKKWDTRLRLGYKYATSSMQGMARFTDAPGYYFDLNAGKDLLKRRDRRLRLMIMAGMYVWQTNSDVRFQNDAILFGLGGRYLAGPFSLEMHIRGYSGYLNNGDRPIVWKTEFSHRINNVSWKVGYQLGLHDFSYQSLEFGGRYWLE